MVTYNDAKSMGYPGKTSLTITGLSTDTKPTDGVQNGSAFIEMDTGNIFFFDEGGSEWLPFDPSGGGGSSSSIVAVECDLTVEYVGGETGTHVRVTPPEGYQPAQLVGVGMQPEDWGNAFTVRNAGTGNYLNLFGYHMTWVTYTGESPYFTADESGYNIRNAEAAAAFVSAYGGKLTLFYDTSIESEVTP